MKKNGELKIEKGIPIPVSGRKGYVAAMRKLQVGDSVVIPGPSHRAHNAISYIGGNKTTHVTRKDGDGFRVWRIK